MILVRRFVFFFITLLLFSWVFIECFVVKREKRTPSGNKTREECCQELGSIVDVGAEIIKKLAYLQQESLKMVQDILQGEKQSSINKASRQELVSIYKQLCTCHQDLEHILTQVNNHATALQAAAQGKLAGNAQNVTSHQEFKMNV